MARSKGMLAVLLVFFMVSVSMVPLATTVVADIDSDGDGYSDKYERQVGTDPEDPNDYPGKDTPKPPPVPDDMYDIDVLPSNRIVASGEDMSAAVYVRQDGEMVDGETVHFMAYILNGMRLDKVHGSTATLSDGRASFMFSPSEAGIYYLVAAIEPDKASMSETTMTSTLVRKQLSGFCGYSIVAAYQGLVTSVRADFLHLLPGMKARTHVTLMALSVDGLSEDIIDRHLDGIDPFSALELYRPVTGTAYLKVSGPQSFSQQKEVPCGPSGGLWEVELPSQGTYTFTGSAFADHSGFVDTASVKVHSPEHNQISIMNRYKLFDLGMLHIASKRVSPDITRETFNELMIEVGGKVGSLLESYPEYAIPLQGKIYYNFLYVKGNTALELKHGAIEFNGSGFMTYEFDVPGTYHIYVMDEPMPMSGGTFHYTGNIGTGYLYRQVTEVVTDHMVTTFPNKKLYFAGEEVKLTSVYMAGTEVVRDIPVAVFLDGSLYGTAQVEEGDFVMKHDLGKLNRGFHVVETFPLMSENAEKVLNAFGISALRSQWTGKATFHVEMIGVYLDIGREAVRGMPYSFRLIALDAPMSPCKDCEFSVKLANMHTSLLVATGTTDEFGSAIVEFDFPDIYSEMLEITVIKDTDSVTIVRNLDPRPATVQGIAVTNKPIYKAGETVMARFLVWNADALEPASGELDLQVEDPAGRQILRERLVLDDHGSAETKIPIGIDKKNGDYSIKAWLPDHQTPVIDSTFRVEEYRTPVVEVLFENDLDEVDDMTKGVVVPFTVQYVFGKGVTEGSVSWEVGFIEQGTNARTYITKDKSDVTGEWPMEIGFDLNTRQDPGDTVYISVEFEDRFGHEAEGETTLFVTEKGERTNVKITTDKEEYEPGDPVMITIDMTKETRSLGETTIEPMDGSEALLKVRTPDNELHTFGITLGVDGTWVGTLSQLGIITDDYHETPLDTRFTLEAFHTPTMSNGEKVVIEFRTIDHILKLDGTEYNAGEEAVIYMAIRDLVAQDLLAGPYDLSIIRKGDSDNVLFTSVGELDDDSVTVVWNIPETLATDTYIVRADLDGVHQEQEVRIDDPTPVDLTITASKDTFGPGDRVEFRIGFAKPFTGFLYIDHVFEGRLTGTSLRFLNPTKEAVVAVKAQDWRSAIGSRAYFVNSVGKVISASTTVDREDLGLDVDVSTNKDEYEPGDIMTLAIEVSERNGALVPNALLSLAVIDATIFDIAQEFDDGSWMASFATPPSLERKFDMVSSWDPTDLIAYGGFVDAAVFYGLSPSAYFQDWDNDGLDNQDEFQMGLSPVMEDTDGDGMLDGYEHYHGLNPTDPSDGLKDKDNDGMTNGWEAMMGLNPFQIYDAYMDPDGDGLICLEEFQLRTHPRDWDTDGDGMSDGWEVEWGLDPADPIDANEDADGDGYTNLEEFWMETLPGRPVGYTANSTSDIDGGGVPDVFEARYGLNPLDPTDDQMDQDGDGWTTLEEYAAGTDPTNANTDGDLYEWDSTDPNPTWNDDPFEEGDSGGEGSGSGQGGGSGNGGGSGGGNGGSGGDSGGSDPSGGGGYSGQGGHDSGDVDWGGGGLTPLDDLKDSDGDGIFDNEENLLGTNPFSSDTDGDGIPDAVDKDPLNFDAPELPEDPTGEDVPEINPFIPHKADSKIIESFHQRKWFTDTAYWSPDLELKTGALHVSILLPDNIGKWRVKASAWTDDLRSGETIIEINSYKGLFVEAIVPEDVFQDDEVTFKARVYNFDDEAKKLTAVLTADEWLRAWGDNERVVSIGAREVKEVPFFVKVDGMHEQEVRFGVTDGRNTDAVTAKTYIEPNGAVKTQHSAGKVLNETLVDLEFYPEYIDGSKNTILKMSAGYEGLFIHGAMALGQYPYDCTEQTMTKLLINTLMWRYHKAQGELDGLTKERLKNTIYENLNRLYSLQHDDGGWGWWEKDTSDAWMTSYVLFGLSMVKEQGFNVDGNSVSGAQFYLVNLAIETDGGMVLWKGTAWLKGKDTTMTATVAYSLARSGHTKLDEVVRYLAQVFASDDIDAYTATLYGLLLEELGYDSTGVQEYLKGMMLSEAHWTAGNSLGGEVETTGWATYFLVKAGTEPQDLRDTLSWLSSKRQGGSWSTTSDSIANLFAVTEVMEHAKNPKADVRVYVNGELVKEFKGLDRSNFKVFNAMFEAFDLTERMDPNRVNEVRIVKEGEGDLFYELTNEQYLRAGVKVSFQAAAQGRVGDLISLWMEVKPDAMENVEMLDLTVAVPQAPGLVLLNTRKVEALGTGSEDGSYRYVHTFAARQKGTYTLAPIVISYQLTAGETPSGVIRDYFGPVDVLVKVPLSELASKPGLKEQDLGDRLNDTRDNIKDKVGDLRDDIKERLNETKDKVKDIKDDITDKKDDIKDELPDIRDEVDVNKRTSGRSLDMDETARIEIDVDAKEEREKVVVVDFVPLELEVLSVSDGGTYEDGRITWEVEAGQESTLGYEVKANEEYSGSLGRAVALKPESIMGISDVARMVFTAKNFVVVRDSQTSAYAGELAKVELNIMTTGDGLWYAAIEDYVPAGATIDEDSVAKNIDDNVLAYQISGTRVTFFVRKANNLTLEYSYTPSLVGTTVAPPAKAYPMYDTANSASSNSEVISVDYLPEEIDDGGGGGGMVTPGVVPLGPPKLTLTKDDIVLGDSVLREKRTTTISVLLHNEGETSGEATVRIYDYDVSAQESHLIGHRVVTVQAWRTELVTITWTPGPGDHRLIAEVDGGGGGSRIQVTVPVSVQEGPSEPFWAESVTPETLVQGPCLLVLMVIVLLGIAGGAHRLGKKRALQEEARLKKRSRSREK